MAEIPTHLAGGAIWVETWRDGLSGVVEDVASDDCMAGIGVAPVALGSVAVDELAPEADAALDPES